MLRSAQHDNRGGLAAILPMLGPKSGSELVLIGFAFCVQHSFLGPERRNWVCFAFLRSARSRPIGFVCTMLEYPKASRPCVVGRPQERMVPKQSIINNPQSISPSRSPPNSQLKTHNSQLAFPILPGPRAQSSKMPVFGPKTGIVSMKGLGAPVDVDLR